MEKMKKKTTINRIKAPMIAVVMALLLVFQMIPSPVFAVDEEEGSTSEDEDAVWAESNIDEMQAELDEVEQKKEDAQAEMDAIAARIGEKEQEVDRINVEVGLKQDEIQRKEEEIEKQTKLITEQQKSIEERYEGLNNRLRTMYKNGSIGFLDVLLGSASFSELMTNIDMVQMIYQSDKETLENLQAHYDSLKAALDELNAMQEQLVSAKDDLVQEKNNAIAAQEELDEAWSIAHDKMEAFEEEARQIASMVYAEQLRVEAELEAIRAEARRKAEEEAARRAAEEAARKAAEEAKRAEEEAALQAQIDELDAAAGELESLISAKEEEVGNAASAVDEKQAEIDAIQAEIDAMLAAVENEEEVDTSELDARKAALEIEKGELETALAGLQGELDDLNSQLDANRGERYGLAPAEYDDSSSSASEPVYYDDYTGGSLAWPVNNAVVSQEFGNYGHNGMDMWSRDYGTQAGAPIYAPASGIVVAPTGYGLGNGYGNGVSIAHGSGVATTYAHLSEVCVEIGEYVTKGQMIGRMGATGMAFGVHLHFSVMVNGVNVNPRLYLE